MRKLVYKALASRHEWKSTQWDYWCLHSTVVDGVLQEYFTRRSLEPSPFFSVNEEWWLKQRGTEQRAEKDLFFFFLFMASRGCSLLPSSFNHWLRFACVLWELTSFSGGWQNPPCSLAANPAQISAPRGSGHGETRDPCSKEGENHWRWILTCMGWAVTAEDDWSIESTLGHSGKLIHFLFTF